MNEQKTLYYKQYGFPKSFSTAHAIINLIENIESAIDNKQFLCTKAFDIADHNTLLLKIQQNGIRGIPHQWFKSYLENRKQFVSIIDAESEIGSVIYGVLQDSVLGPLLCLIYINDHHYAIKASYPLHFADDIYLLNIQSSIKQIKNP